MSLERVLHDASLHTAASAVDQANLTKAEVPRGCHVLVDDGWNIAGGEGVQIEPVLDGDPEGHGAL